MHPEPNASGRRSGGPARHGRQHSLHPPLWRSGSSGATARRDESTWGRCGGSGRRPGPCPSSSLDSVADGPPGDSPAQQARVWHVKGSGQKLLHEGGESPGTARAARPTTQANSANGPVAVNFQIRPNIKEPVR